MTYESTSQIDKAVNDPSESLCPNAVLVRYITSRTIHIDLIRFLNGKRPKAG